MVKAVKNTQEHVSKKIRLDLKNKGLLFRKLKTNMIQKMNQKFIFYFLPADVIKRSMITYYVKCRKNTENLNSKIFKQKMRD